MHRKASCRVSAARVQSIVGSPNRQNNYTIFTNVHISNIRVCLALYLGEGLFGGTCSCIRIVKPAGTPFGLSWDTRLPSQISFSGGPNGQPVGPSQLFLHTAGERGDIRSVARH